MVLHLRNNTGAGGGGAATPGGADTQVQFNDGGALGGDAGLSYNKTTDKLSVGGDLDLGTVGTFSTTLQSVTPTANRTVSIPDATGTIGLVNGPTGSIQFNEAGALNGTSDFSTSLVWDSATTFTGLKLNVTDTAGAADSNLLDLQVNGVSQFGIAPNDPGWTGGNSLGIISKRLNIQSFYGSTFISNGSGAANGLKIGQAGSGYLDITASDGGVGFHLLNGQTFLTTDAAHTFAQRNGTNAQTYRLYNTYNSPTDYARGYFTFSGQELQIGTEKQTQVAAQAIRLKTATQTEPIYLAPGGFNFFSVDSVNQVRTGLPINMAAAYTFATLPAGAVGYITRITDGDTSLTPGTVLSGANTGNGTNTPYLCWYNGTNWTVIGA